MHVGCSRLSTLHVASAKYSCGVFATRDTPKFSVTEASAKRTLRQLFGTRLRGLFSEHVHISLCTGDTKLQVPRLPAAAAAAAAEGVGEGLRCARSLAARASG